MVWKIDDQFVLICGIFIASVGFHIVSLLVQTLILYLNQRRQVLWLSLGQLLLSIALTFIYFFFFRRSLPLGTGYLFAAAISCVATIAVYLNLLNDLSMRVMDDYATSFMRPGRLEKAAAK